MKMTVENISKYTRQNTGSALGDSGKFYGYIHQRPLPKKLVYYNGDGHSISLTHWLYGLLHCEEEQISLNDHWEKESDIELFVESQKWQYLRVDNSYNYTNNLDQDIQYHAAKCGDTTYFIIRSHNGCDIRGGYSSPMIFRPDDDELEYLQTLPSMEVSYRGQDDFTTNYLESNGKYAGESFIHNSVARPLEELLDFCEKHVPGADPVFTDEGVSVTNENISLRFQAYIDCPNFYDWF